MTFPRRHYPQTQPPSPVQELLTAFNPTQLLMLFAMAVLGLVSWIVGGVLQSLASQENARLRTERDAALAVIYRKGNLPMRYDYAMGIRR